MNFLWTNDRAKRPTGWDRVRERENERELWTIVKCFFQNATSVSICFVKKHTNTFVPQCYSVAAIEIDIYNCKIKEKKNTLKMYPKPLGKPFATTFSSCLLCSFCSLYSVFSVRIHVKCGWVGVENSIRLL